jgi:rubrerythrin
VELTRNMEQESARDYNLWANKCSANADSGSKKVFEALVDDEERHFDQYDLEIDKLEKFGDRYLALQSIEGIKITPERLRGRAGCAFYQKNEKNTPCLEGITSRKRGEGEKA